MTFTFKPAIYKNSVLYELPRPVPVVRMRDAWDAGRFKVPLADGDALVGHSRQGVEISIEGQIGSQSGTLKTSEGDILQAAELLRERLDVSSDAEKFELFLYHDTASGTYRKFKICSTVQFEIDLSNQNLFTYSMVVHAEDPVLYTTAPGG
jgi:hypothetical protein